jgi:hypothetical protein
LKLKLKIKGHLLDAATKDSIEFTLCSYQGEKNNNMLVIMKATHGITFGLQVSIIDVK